MRMLTALLFLLSGFCLVDVHAQGVTRGTIAFVNYEQVFTNYFRSKLANDQIQEMLAAGDRERAMMVLAYDRIQEEMKDLKAKLISPETRPETKDSLRRQIDAKVAELKQLEERVKVFNDAQNKRIEEQTRRMRNNIMNELKTKIAVYAESKGYLAIVDGSQANDKGVPTLLYLDPRSDITKEVTDEVNK